MPGTLYRPLEKLEWSISLGELAETVAMPRTADLEMAERQRFGTARWGTGAAALRQTNCSETNEASVQMFSNIRKSQQLSGVLVNT